ncbi:HNH endonuclease [Glaciimonas sp. GNP009]
MCSACHKPIAKRTPWGVRHIVKKAEGGSDAASNLLMHHFSCHGNR